MFLRAVRLLPVMGIVWAFAGAIPARANLVINVIYDSNVPPQAQAVFNQVASLYQSLYANSITVTVRVKFGTTSLGSSQTYITNQSYTDWRSAMQTNAGMHGENDVLEAAAASLPANDPIGNGNVTLTTANARALGLAADPPAGQPDGFISFNSNPTIFDYSNGPTPGLYHFADVAAHELNEVLGIGSALSGLANDAPVPTDNYAPEDYFRYGSNGTRLISTKRNAQVYFSYDAGQTLLQQFNQQAGGDFNDWITANCQTVLIQDAFACPNTAPPLDGAPEFTVLEALGYDYFMFEPLVTYLFRH